MPRENSPYIRDPYWLDKRRDGRSKFWQIARYEGGTVLYRSTRKLDEDAARAAMDAYIDAQKSLSPQKPDEAPVVSMLVNYWKEKGCKSINSDQTSRSLRTFAAFLAQDMAGAHAVVVDMGPALFERFREWRIGPHDFKLAWFGEQYDYSSGGVSGATVQRNINDVRAAVHHAEANLRIPLAPRIRDLDQRYLSVPRERVLTIQEMGKIAWFASHNPALFRFAALQLATGVRPMAAMAFDPVTQYDDRRGLIDLQPGASPQTRKRNSIIPAIRPIRPILRAWAKDGADEVKSRKTAWRNMRRALGLSDDVFPKTIRHTVATMLYEDESVPEREIVEMLGHEGKLARTTRIYAKYNPTRLRAVTRALATIWLQVSKEARSFGSDHSLATGLSGGKLKVVQKVE
ncbi:tyrosine-type recombinase/integrase [Qipengyuania pacifica]|uniref:tyrosine-type recombinase/integrase n=1 Tax=Qipengyuania pacifica TaxID=2860199 RepID=UPI001C9E1C3C|nr:tyrosine-type recombinase/integrase [Qipengyuania pacifica]MBY8333164.1 tyrosine-type recombinase/integrase [Qipengyuania pacifica]